MAREDFGKRQVISMIGISPAIDENVIPTFEAGAKKAVHGITVRVDYSHDFLHPGKCAAIASRQIDRERSRVVYADAGGCSTGALQAVQENRGVWGVEGDQARNTAFGPQILGYTVKDFGQEVDYAIQHYVDHTLSHCHVDIGIEVRAVDFQANNSLIPERYLADLQAVRHERMPIWRGWARAVCGPPGHMYVRVQRS